MAPTILSLSKRSRGWRATIQCQETMAATTPLKCQLLLCLLTSLLSLCSPSEGSEAEFMTSLISGVDGISSALTESEASCSKGEFSEKFEEEVSRLDEFVARQMEMISSVRDAVENTSSAVDNLYGNLTPTTKPTICEDPFTMTAGSCFWIHKGPSRSWENARRRCQVAGGDLATPDDMPGVVNFIKGKLGLGWYYVWLGGQVVGSRTVQWVGTPGEVEKIEYRHWYQPRDAGRCTAFNGGKGLRIMGWDCDDTLWFLCEIKL